MTTRDARPWIVTGAAHGLGKAVALELAGLGRALFLVDVDERALLATCEAVRGAGAASVESLTCDLASSDACDGLARAVTGAHGALAGLVHCAGVAVTGDLRRAELADWEWLLAVNFWAPVRLTQALLPLLQQSPPAVVGFVASSFAWLPAPGKAAYAASKAALVRFAESLAVELYGSNVRVVTIYPGPLATEIVTRGRNADAARAEREQRFLLRSGARPDVAARAAVRALLRGKVRARLGWLVRASDWAARLAPAALPRLFGRWRDRLPF